MLEKKTNTLLVGVAILIVLAPSAAACNHEINEVNEEYDSVDEEAPKSDCYEADFGTSDPQKKTFVYPDTEGTEKVVLVVVNEEVRAWMSLTLWTNCVV